MDQGRSFKPAPGKQSSSAPVPTGELQPGKRTLTETVGGAPVTGQPRSPVAQGGPAGPGGGAPPGVSMPGGGAPGVSAPPGPGSVPAPVPLDRLFGHRGEQTSSEQGSAVPVSGGGTARPDPAGAERLAAHRARLERPGYAYVRPFAEPVIAGLERGAVAQGEQVRAHKQLDDMFDVSHSPDGRGLPAIKQASNDHHAALGAEAIGAMRPGPDRAAFAAEAARVAASYTPRLEDGVQMTATPRGDGAELTIAPNDWRRLIVPVIVGVVVVGVGVAYLMGAFTGGSGNGEKDDGSKDKPKKDEKDEPKKDEKDEPKKDPEPSDDRRLKDDHEPVLELGVREHVQPERGVEARAYSALDRRGKAGGDRTEGAVLEAADRSFAEAAKAALPDADSTPATDAEHTYKLRQGKHEFTIRLMECPLGDRVFRSIVNPTKDAHVLQLSASALDTDVARAVAHGVAEIGELRRTAQTHQAPVDQDLLRRGPRIGHQEVLSARDLGAIAEIRVLGTQHKAARHEPEVRRIERELRMLIDDLGLRAGTPGAGERWQLIQDRLADEAKLVGEARRPDQDLEHEELGQLNLDREQREDQHTRRALDEAPLHEMPAPKGKISPEVADKLAQGAQLRRAVKSEQVVARLRKEAEQGKHDGSYPVVKDPQIGGGAALAAIRPGQLLIDDRKRWQADPSHAIAQTAMQLRSMVDSGLGDPLQFVDHPDDRPPLSAIRYFEDSIAAQADVVNGTGALALDPKAGMLLTIHPSDGAGHVQVQVAGTPLIASGFPRERVPGQRDVSTLDAITRLMKALESAKSGQAPEAREALARADMSKHDQLGRVLEPFSEALDEIKHQDGVPEALAVLELHGRWSELREGRKELVLQGDEANLEAIRPRLADRWLIAGVGGTSISAAEIILHGNDKAKVTMIGGSPPAGLNSNDQFRQVFAQYGPTGENRFDVLTEQRLDAPELDKKGGTLSVGKPLSAKAKIDEADHKGTVKPMESDSWLALAAGLPQIEAVAHVLGTNPRAKVKLVAGHIRDEVRMHDMFLELVKTHGPISPQPRLEIASGAGFEKLVGGPKDTFETAGSVSAEGYVNSLGRGGQASPVIEELIRQARFARHEVSGQLLWSEHEEYLGYRITIDTGSEKRSFDVTGAASRFLPGGVFESDDRDMVMARQGHTPVSARHDAPPEGGNFDGGFAASATQAARYGRHMRKASEREAAEQLRKHHRDGLQVDLSEIVESSWPGHVRDELARILKVDPDRVMVKQLDRDGHSATWKATLGGFDLGPIHSKCG